MRLIHHAVSHSAVVLCCAGQASSKFPWLSFMPLFFGLLCLNMIVPGAVSLVRPTPPPKKTKKNSRRSDCRALGLIRKMKERELAETTNYDRATAPEAHLSVVFANLSLIRAISFHSHPLEHEFVFVLRGLHDASHMKPSTNPHLVPFSD